MKELILTSNLSHFLGQLMPIWPSGRVSSYRVAHERHQLDCSQTGSLTAKTKCQNTPGVPRLENSDQALGTAVQDLLEHIHQLVHKEHLVIGGETANTGKLPLGGK